MIVTTKINCSVWVDASSQDALAAVSGLDINLFLFSPFLFDETPNAYSRQADLSLEKISAFLTIASEGSGSIVSVSVEYPLDIDPDFSAERDMHPVCHFEAEIPRMLAGLKKYIETGEASGSLLTKRINRSSYNLLPV